MLFARIDNANTVLEFRDMAAQPPDLPQKGWRWRPVVDTDPAVDPATQVKEGPVIAFASNQVTRTWTVRAKSAGELQGEKQARADNAFLSPGMVAIVRHLAADKAIPEAALLAQLKARVD